MRLALSVVLVLGFFTTSIAADNNEFAIRFYKEVAAKKGNQFISPFSISTAFGMVYAGAGGKTAEEIANVFHFDPSQAKQNEAFRKLLSAYSSEHKEYELKTANRLWLEQTYSLLPSYLRDTKTFFLAEPARVDFKKDRKGAKTRINRWVVEKTKGRIQNLVGELKPLTRLVLTNAIYFKGEWEHAFEKRDTTPEKFTTEADEKLQASMMRQVESFRYLGNNEVQAVELPYRSGDLSMVVILPRGERGLQELERNLTARWLTKTISEMSQNKLHLFLPKFRMAPTEPLNLNKPLAKMGVALAFRRFEADFSGMSTPPKREDRLFLSRAVHKAFIEVDEEGTEAAAATAVFMESAGGYPSEPIIFRADHPFLFLIRDTRTESILFIGRYVGPNG